MEFRHLAALSSLFCLALLGSHVQASEHAEAFWQSLWPSTPMPKALRDLTQPGNWNWRTSGRAYAKLDHNKEGKIRFSDANDDKIRYNHDNDDKIRYKIRYNHDNDDKIRYNHDNDDKIRYNDPTRIKNTILNGIFFLENNLHPGKKLKMEFTKRSDELTFLPDTVAKTIPFSSSRLPEILKRFKLEAKSADAETVKHTIELCESPTMTGEEKYCATSLESLVNFAVSKLGKNTRLLSTEFQKETQNWQQYTVAEGVKKNGDKAVVCHKLNYPYAVFYCHKIDTRVYTVPLVAVGDGTKAKALAVCHTDTTHWNPKHVAFKQLKVKPGTVPICHFLVTDTLLWVPK